MTTETLHDFTLSAIDGKPLPFSRFAGQVVLLVNTASECSYTGQYEGLEKLWLDNRNAGLVVIGAPSNDFGGQEPGSAPEIATFCIKNFGVTFPLTEKLVVKGAGAHPLYKWVVGKAGGQPKWNFHKYLFGRDGRFIGSMSSRAKPLGPTVTQAVARALAQARP